MKAKFWGVRGSIPSPSTEGNGFFTDKYGGNTSCLEVIANSGDEYIFDAGSGIRMLGNDLIKRGFTGKGKAKVFLSHLHHDHIQGWPFFMQAYVPGNEFDIYSGARDGKTIEQVFKDMMADPTFPVSLDQMMAKMNFKDIPKGDVVQNGVTVSYTETAHPNQCFSYKVQEKGEDQIMRTLVYATDTEHDGNGKLGPNDKKMVEWAKGADVLIYDAQYTPEEYNPADFGLPGMSKKGWGHSTYEKAIQIALQAGVKEVVLFHHDPSHDDKKMDKINQLAQQYLSDKGAEDKLKVTVAYEGLEIQL
ncbi:MAG: MBL fold metallo-hydrolase [Nanoarchaeota archaeon]|nr:MBL fold metallo-hydrolase [Nanoarchaeota archaeon]